MKRAAGYIRVSTMAQAKHGESLSTQRKEIRNFIKSKGWEFIKIYADEGVSGSTTEKREYFQQLMQHAAARKFDVVVVHKLSRFARNARDLLNKVEELKGYKIELASIKEKIDLTNPYGAFMLTMLGAVAQLERDIIFDQMNENKLARWQRGEIFVGRPPFGYRWNKQKKCIEVVKEEAEVYKRIVDMYMNLGLSFKEIESRLKAENLKCKNAVFSSGVISYILKNPAYHGRYFVNKHIYENGKRTDKLRPLGEQFPFKIPRLISKSKWDKIQAQTDFNRVRSKRSEATKDYWLRDVLECGECGGRVKPYHGSKRKDGSSPAYYTCYWRQTSERELKLKEKQRCVLPFIKAEKLQNLIWYQLFAKLSLGTRRKKSDIEKVVDLKRYDRQIKELERKIDSLKADLKRKQTAQQRIYGLLEEDGFTKDEFLRKLRETDDKIIYLKDYLAETEEKIEAVKAAKANDKVLRDFLKNKGKLIDRFYQDLTALSSEDKKRLVESMLSEKIRLVKEHEGDEGWANLPYQFSFNPAIFEDFMKKGKIVKLNADDADHPATHHL